MSRRREEDGDFSIEDFIIGRDGGKSKNIEDYEDEYVYGDSEELDIEDYIQPEDKGYVSKYRSRFEDEEVEIEEEFEEDLGEKIDRRVNKVLDFFESKQFTALQWSITVGVLLLMWGVIYLVSSASRNIEDNAVHQEQSNSSFVAKQVAPDEYTSFEEDEAERERQQEDLDKYLEEGVRGYETQKDELGELPEGYTEVLDIDGNLSYLSPEEYEEYLEGDVRTPSTEEDTGDALGGLKVEIVPSDEIIWDNISFGDLKDLTEKEVYQTRGEYIYFAQRIISLKFPYQVIDSDFDSEEHILTVKMNPYSDIELPEDFEERMHFAFDHSGYGIQYGGGLEIIYEDADI